MRSDMEWAEMVELHRQGVSMGDIANKLGVDRKTVRRYVQAGSPSRYSRAARGSKLDPYTDFTKDKLAEDPYSAPKMLRMIREKGYDGGISILKDFMKPLRDASRVAAEIRFETRPGEQAQVDWIDLGRHEIDGEVIHLYCFTMVLGYSRYAYAEFTDNVRTETFVHCHLRGFEPFGGCPRSILVMGH